MSENDPGSVTCPRCSAQNFAGSLRCFLCDEPLAGAPKSAPASTAPARNRPTFRLNSMMLLIALIAVFLGVWHEAPGLGVVLAVPGTIALIRTLRVSSGPDGRPASGLDHVVVFIATFSAVVGVAIAAVVAFFATCLAIASTGSGRYGGDHLGAGLVIGAIAGLATIIGLTVVLVRRSRRRAAKATGSGSLS